MDSAAIQIGGGRIGTIMRSGENREQHSISSATNVELLQLVCGFVFFS